MLELKNSSACFSLRSITELCSNKQSVNVKTLQITKINYQQPHYLLYYCHLSENNGKKSILMEWNGKPCYENNIAPKSFVTRVIKAVLINMTAPSCSQKSEYCNYYKKTQTIIQRNQFSSLDGLITREYYRK